jgi:glucosamine 6-phosphate synthetase-like amidotransferase/phosphosugar isomerase protein
MKMTGNKVLIGHNRYATAGAINSINAHPFQHGDLFGVHNGTLRGQHLLPDSRDYDVDSDNIYHSFNKIGVKETVKVLHGAYALVWWDAKRNMLNMLRNSERTLYYATSASGAVFWASEEGMLITALERNKITSYNIVEVQTDKLYQFELTQAAVNGAVVVEKPRVSAVTPYVPPATFGRYGGNTQYSQQGRYNPPAKQLPAASPKVSQIGGNSTKKQVDAALLHSGYRDGLESLNFTLDKYMARNGTALFTTLDSNAITLRITGVTRKAGVALEQLDDFAFYTVSDVLSFVRTGNKITRLTATSAELQEHLWSDTELNTIDPEPTRAGHDGKQIDEKEFNKHYTACSICSQTLMFEDSSALLYSANEGICGECNTSPEQQEVVKYINRC